MTPEMIESFNLAIQQFDHMKDDQKNRASNLLIK